MKKLWVVVPFLLSFAFILLPETAAAAFFGPIVPPACHCPESAPDWGCVIQIIRNGMNLAISIGVILAAIAIAYAGALWMLSPLNPQMREQGRTMLMNTVIGLVVVLTAWIFVDAVMVAVYKPENGGFGPWQEIVAKDTPEASFCIKENENIPQTAQPSQTPTPSTDTDIDDDGTDNAADADDDGDGRPDASDNCPNVANANQADADNDGTGDACEQQATPTPTPSTSGCSTCAKVASVAHKTPAENGCRLSGGRDGLAAITPPTDYCYVNSGLLSKLQATVGTNTGWRVTEMWPPTVNHVADCHSNGTCVDVARTSGTPTDTQIKDMAVRFKGQGLYVVYESSTMTADRCRAILNDISNPGAQIKMIRYNGNPHFSVYTSEHQRDDEGCSAL